MLADPTLAPIEQKKTFGLWPPSKDNIADSLYPYIKRMKQEKVDIFVIGDNLGEVSVRFMELDEVGKIGSIDTGNSLVPDYQSIMEENIGKYEKIKLVNACEKEYDIVYIDGSYLEKNELIPLKALYDKVKSHGIFCGNDHHKTYVKDNLFKFRRDNRIGTPIHVSNRLCWFWIKR